MNFKEARNLLNDLDTESVSKEMEDWHPTMLGQMLLAVSKATQKRCVGSHPNFMDPLNRLATFHNLQVWLDQGKGNHG